MYRRAFAVFAAAVLLLVSWNVLSNPASASAAPAADPETEATYGPGYSVTNGRDGSALVRYLPTFRRWDGVWRPETALNVSNGEWPYVIEETPEAIAVTRFGMTFTQAKVPSARYEFSPQRIKETIVIALVPQDPVLVIPFATGFALDVSGTTITLSDAGGTVVWTTDPFQAWDSAETPRTWENAVTSVDYIGGDLVLVLDASMIASAAYPLYIDPTWALGNTIGWGASTFQDAVVDQGDKKIRLGWLADNFDDNLNEIWTVESGAATFAGGVLQLQPSTLVRAGSSTSDQRLGFMVRFTSSGTAQVYFRTQDANNHYVLDVSESGDSLTLKKRVAGSLSTIASVTGVPIDVNTDYRGRIHASGNAFEIWWPATVLRWSGSDGSPPPSPISGPIKLGTDAGTTAHFDDVRVWNTSIGTMTTPVRDAGATNKPLTSGISGQLDGYSQAHIRIRSSPDNVSWGPWTNVKADVGRQMFRSVPDQDRQRYYQLRVTLTSGVEGTPAVSEVSATEGTPSTSPSANTGFERWYPYVGGLVNAVNGNLWYSARDLSVQGRGFDIAFVRSYNSQRGGEVGPLGNGWTHGFRTRLVVGAPPNPPVVYEDGDGSKHTFNAKEATGGYAPPRGLPIRLVRNADGSYTLWAPDGGSQAYTSTGRLTSIRDKNGNALTLTYDGSSRLTSIADDSGKSLLLAYDGSNRISSVTDPGLNRQVVYGYDGSSNLISVTDAMSHVTSYAYASGKMTAMIDPVGKRTAFTYDGSNRVTEVWLGLYEGGSVVWQFRDYSIGYTSTTSRTVTNARGVSTTVTLNSNGNPTQVSGPSIGSGCCDSAGNTSSSLWDGEMNRIRLTDGRGNVRLNDYDHRSNLISTTDPGGNTSTSSRSEYNNANAYAVLLKSHTNFRGHTTTYAHDGLGNLVSVTNAKGLVSTNVYDSLGFLNRSTDFRGFTTWYEYNLHRYLTKVTNPLNHATQFGYDAAGRQTTATSPGGNVTTTTYDSVNRRTRVTDPLGNFTDYGYNGRGDLTTVTDPNGFVTTYAINVTNHRVRVTTDAMGNSTTLAFDLRGNAVSVTDPKGQATTYEYDIYDRITKERSPLGFETTYAYDAAGNRIRRTDANGAATLFGYDQHNRMTSTTYPGGSVVGFAFDQNGNVVSETGFGYTKTSAYDQLDQVTSVTTNYGAFSKALAYAYDANGNRLAVRQPEDPFPTLTLRPTANGGTVQWSAVGCTQNWDCVDDVANDGDATRVQSTSPGQVDDYHLSDVPAQTPPIRFVTITALVRIPVITAYDCQAELGDECWANLQLRVNGFDSDLIWVGSRTYVFIGRTWTANPATNQPWTASDVNALQAGIRFVNGNSPFNPRATQLFVTVEFEHNAYDAANRPTAIWDPEGGATAFGYDRDSRRTSVIYVNGATTTWTYDKANRVTKVETKKSDSTPLDRHEYTYDKAGNRLTMKDSGATTTYEYDRLHRLTKEVDPTGWITTYAYDAVGNRIRRTSGSSVTDYTYDADNRLTREEYLGGSVFTYEYDPNGNLVREWDDVMNPTEYTYDKENRLLRVYYPNSGLSHDYTYAPTGQRMSYASGGSTTYFGHDYFGGGVYEDRVAEYSSTGVRQARYTHGPGVDEPIGLLRGGSKYNYHTDALGSVRRMTDAGQNTARSYRYDTWGRITDQTGTLENPYVFTGRERDAGSSLYYYRARMYDPDVGRFVGKDPGGMVDGPNLYAYVGNNPVNRIDSSGRSLIATSACAVVFTIVIPIIILLLYALFKYPPGNGEVNFHYIMAVLLMIALFALGAVLVCASAFRAVSGPSVGVEVPIVYPV